MAPEETAPPTKRRSILIVEDDGITRAIIVRYFEAAGLDVHAAENGADALEILRRHGPSIDWLFTDIHLPGEISGWIVGAEFNLNHPLRPVIYATASANQALVQAAGSVFIHKPYSPSEVFSVFKELESRAAAVSDAVGPYLRGEGGVTAARRRSAKP
jgi:two-component system, OmpR family, response regulator